MLINIYKNEQNLPIEERKYGKYIMDTLHSFAEHYYSHFTDYILKWKPDIIGHFDLLTKFDEKERNYYLASPEYHKLADNVLAA